MTGPTFAYRNQAEFRVIRDAEGSGRAFVLLRDGLGELRAHVLDPSGPAVLGRQEGCDLRLEWDERVSRIHATLESTGGDWTLLDAGRSLNGTYVNGERVSRRVRLTDRDVLRLGDVDMLFRAPRAGASAATATADDGPRAAALLATLTTRERAILAALCAPLDPLTGGEPAANSRIAAEVGIEVPNVKAALTVLFQKFGLSRLEPSEKRRRLAELALRYGVAPPGGGGA